MFSGRGYGSQGAVDRPVLSFCGLTFHVFVRRFFVNDCGGAPQLAPRASQSCGGIGMFRGVPQILLLVIYVQSQAECCSSSSCIFWALWSQTGLGRGVMRMSIRS